MAWEKKKNKGTINGKKALSMDNQKGMGKEEK